MSDHSSTLVRGVGARLQRRVAPVVAMALCASSLATGLAFAPWMDQEAAAVTTTGTLNTGGWRLLNGVEPINMQPNTAHTGAARPFTPMDGNTLYFSSSDYLGTVGYFSNPTSSATEALIGYGTNTWAQSTTTPMSTMAVDADPNGQRGARSAYLWSRNSANALDKAGNGGVAVPKDTMPIFRWQNVNSTAPYKNLTIKAYYDGAYNLVPTQQFFYNNGLAPKQPGNSYWGGGAVIQSTGEILFGAAEGATLDSSYNQMIWNPATGAYNFSGLIKPLTAGDDIFSKGPATSCSTNCPADGYVASDLVTDTAGNAYIIVTSTEAASKFGLSAARRNWLVRVTPSAAMGQPWTYQLVTPLTAPAGSSAAATSVAQGSAVMYGMAVYNGLIYVTNTTKNALVTVNPTTGVVTAIPGTMGKVACCVYDLASGQSVPSMGMLQGTVYNDANANGTIDSGEAGVQNQTVALYQQNASGQYVYMGSSTTDANGKYSFAISSVGNYVVRLVQPGIGGVNAVQTWANGSSGNGNTVTPACVNNSGISSAAGGVCYGALPMPAVDPALPSSGAGSDTSTQPSQMPIYTVVKVGSASSTVNADFGVTTLGSFGDSPMGPASISAKAPVHINGLNPATAVYLGSDNGQHYNAPASNVTAHTSDDGLYIPSATGNISLQGTVLAATGSYTLSAAVNGGGVGSSTQVVGWTTGVGGTSWNTTPAWSPTLSGNTASGTYQAQPSGTVAGTPNVNLRAEVSNQKVTLPTNANNEYQASATGNQPWATPGEIEDYSYQVADSVWRGAVSTTKGTTSVTLDGVTNTVSPTWTMYPAKATTPGSLKTVTATAPNGWYVSSVAVQYTTTGQPATADNPAWTTTGQTTTISWTPKLGDDITVALVYAPAPSIGNSTLTVDKTETPVNTNITATATLKDADGVPVPGQVVQFAVDKSTATLSTPTCTTDNTGTCSVTVTDSVAEDVNISATYNGSPLTGSPQKVTFTSGPGYAPDSTLTVTPAGPLPVGTDSSSTYTAKATIVDQGGNPSVGQVVTFTVTDPNNQPVSGQPVLSSQTCTTGTDGTCSVTLTSTKSGTFAVHATIPDATSGAATELGHGSPAPVSWVAGPPAAGTSTITVDNTDPTIGDNVTATVHLFDQYGNPANADGVQIPFTVSGDNATIAEPSTCTVPAGSNECSVTFTDSVAETVNVNATVDGAPVGDGKGVDVTFHAGPAVPGNTTLTVDKESTEVGTNITATVTAKDAGGNPVGGTTVTFSVDNSGDLSEDTCVTGDGTNGTTLGECSVKITDTKAEQVTLHATIPDPDNDGAATDVSGSPKTLTFTPGPLCVTGETCQTRVEVTLNNQVADDQTEDTITAYTYDIYGNPVSDTITFATDDAALHFVGGNTITTSATTGQGTLGATSPVAGTHIATATYEGTEVSGSPLELNFTPGNADANTSTLTVDKSETPVTTNITATATVKDATGNLLANQTVSFTVNGDATLGGTTEQAGTCTTGTDGTCTITITDEKAENVTFRGYVNGSDEIGARNADGTPVDPETGSPKTLSFTHGPVSADTSTLTVDQNEVNIGDTITATATTRDAQGNPVPGTEVTFTVDGAATLNDGTAQTYTCTTGDDGTCQVTITDNTPQDVTLHATIVDPQSQQPVDIKDSPATLTFNQIPPSATNSVLTVTPDGPLQVGTAAANTYTATVTVKDDLGNLVSGQTVTFSVNNQGQLSDTTCTTDTTGQCSVRVTDTKAETVTLHATIATADNPAADVTNSPKDLVFVHGPVSATLSTLDAQPRTQTAGSPVTTTITLVDDYGNPIDGLNASDFTLTGTPTTDSSLPNLTFANFSPQGNGVYTFTTTSKLVGTFTIGATVDGTKIDQTVDVTFIAGDVCVQNCTPVNPANVTQVYMTKNDQPADGSSQDTAQAKAYDTYGNAVQNAVFTVTDQTAGALAGILQPPTQTCTTNAAGTCDLAWTSTRNGVFTAAATVKSGSMTTGLAVTSNNDLDNIRFITGDVSVADSTLTLDQHEVTVGSTVNATVKAVDASGNAISGVGVTFTLSGNATMSPSTLTCNTGADGTCTVQITDTKAEQVTLHAFIGGVDVGTSNGTSTHPETASPQTITFNAGPVCTTGALCKTSIAVTLDNQAADGLTQDIITATASDQYGNPVSATFQLTTTADALDLKATSITTDAGTGQGTAGATSMTAGTYRVDATVNGATPSGSPLYLSFGAGRPATITLTMNPAEVEVDTPITLTATVIDANGNPIPNVGVTMPLDADGQTGLYLTEPNVDGDLLTGMCTTNSAGQCSVDVTSHIVKVYTVIAYAGNQQSFPAGTGNSGAVPLNALLAISPRMAPSDDGTSPDPVTPVTTDAPITTTAAAAADDDTIGSNPVNPGFKAGPPSPDNSFVVVTQDGAAADGSDRNVVTVYVADRYGNAVVGATVTATPRDGQTGLVAQSSIGPTTYQTSGCPERLTSLGVDTCASTTIWFTSTVAGEKLANILITSPLGADGNTVIPDGGNPVALHFGSGKGDADHSSWTITPDGPLTVGDDASSAYTLTATINDVFDTPVAGAIVAFSANPTTTAWGANPMTCTTLADGTCAVTVTSEKAGTFAFTAALAGDPIGSAQSRAWEPGPVDGSQSTVEVTKDHAIADGTSIDEVTVTARDQYGNPVSGQVVTSTSTDSTLTIQTGIASTNSNGQTTVWYTSKKSGAKTTDITIGTSKVVPTGSPATLNFDPGTAVASHSSLAVDTTTPLVGDTVTATVTARDINDNLVPNTVVSFTVNNNGKLSDQTCTTNNTGTCSVTLTDDKAEDVVLHATVGGSDVQNSPQTITFGAKQGVAPNSTLEVDKTSTTVGTNITATVTAKDGSGNLAPQTEIAFTVTNDGKVSADTCTTGDDGTCSVTITDTKAEDVVLHATIDGDDIVNSPKTLTFVPGDPSASNSDLSVDPTTQKAGSPVTVTVTVRDQYNNPIPNLTADDFAMTGTSSGLPDLVFTNFAPGPDGTYTFQTTSPKAGTFTIGATVKGVTLDKTVQVTFIPGDVCVQNCAIASNVKLTQNDQPADGTSQDTAVATAYDTYGNLVPNATFSVTDESTGALAGYLKPASQTCTTGANGQCNLAWTSTKDGVFTAAATVKSGDMTTPLEVTDAADLSNIRFIPGNVSAAKSTLVVDKETATVGTNITATATARDDNGNLVSNVGVTFTLTGNATMSPALSCNTGSDGTCQVTITDKKAEQVTLTGAIGGQEIGHDASGALVGTPAQSSPKTLTFTADAVCVEEDDCTQQSDNHTRVAVTKDNATANGTDTDVITAYAYDQFGNPVAATFALTAEDTTNLHLAATSITTSATTGEGTTSATSQVANSYTVHAAVNGTELTDHGSPLTLNFLAGSLSSIELSISPDGSQPVGSTFTVTATAKDASGNPVSQAGVTLTLPPDLTTPNGSPATCTTRSDGTCTVDVTSTKPGTYPITAAGTPSNTVNAVFTVGPPDGTKSFVTITHNGAPANGVQQNTITVTVMDSYGNPISGATVTSTPVEGSSADLLTQPNIAKTGSDGTTTIWYTATSVGDKSSNIRITDPLGTDGQPVIPTGGNPVTVTFGQPGGVPANSSWTITPNQPLVVGLGADSTFTLTATINDADNVPVNGAVVTFGVDQSTTAWGATPKTCTTGSNGQCFVTVTSTKAGTFAFTASISAGALGGAKTAVWTPGPVDADHSSVVVTKDNANADGMAQDIATVTARDQYDNLVPQQIVKSTSSDTALTIQQGIQPTGDDGTTTIWYTSTVAGAHQATVTIGTANVEPKKSGESSPITLNFRTTTPNPGNSSLAVSTNTAQAGEPVTATVTVKDGTNNLVSGVEATVTLVSPSGAATFGTIGETPVTTQTCTTTSAGTCTVTFTDTVTEDVAVHGYVPVNGSPAEVSNSPQTVTFTHACIAGVEPDCTPGPNVDNDHRTQVQVTTDNQVAGSGTDVATAKIFDKYGNAVDDATVTSTSDDTTLTIGTPTLVADSSNVYTIGYQTSNTTATTTTAEVLVNGTQITFIPQEGSALDNPTDIALRSSPVTLHFVDHTAPAAPVITSPKNGDVINASDVDPQDGTTTITGTGEPGDTVVVNVNGTPIDGCTADDNVTVASDGTWSCKAVLPQGEDTLIAQQTDPSGNESAGSTPVTVTVDTQKPDAPAITSPKDGDTINKGDLNPDGTTTITGTGEPGATVDVTNNDTPLENCQNLTVNAAGVWTCNAVLPQGDDTLVATQTDPAGNTSDPSAPVTVTVSTEQPAAPVITSPKDGDTINKADLNPDGKTVPITGTGTAGNTVDVTLNGSPLATCQDVTVASDGTWTCNAELPQGTDTLVATQTDPAGNTSGNSNTVTVTVDTVAPDAPVITSPSDNTLTNDNTPVISGTGEPGNTIDVVDVTDPNNPVTLCENVTVQADGTWSCTSSTLSDGDHTIVANQTDPAGNKSGDSTPIHVTVDTTAPAAPVITSPADNSTLNKADIPDGTVPVTGTGEAGDKVNVTYDGGKDLPGCTNITVASDGTWSCDATLADGSHTLVATQTDPAGNKSGESNTVHVTIDTSTPSTPTITSPTQGEQTNDPTPPITGTGDPGDSVVVTEPGNPDPICTATVQADGTWSCTPSTPLEDGDHTITAQQTDPAGNPSEYAPDVTFTVDTQAPEPPVIQAPADGSSVNTHTPTISGTGEPNATLTVTDVTNPDSPKVLCENVAVGSDGKWSCTSSTLDDGTYTIVANQTDAAGNVSDDSTPVHFTVDTSTVPAPVITSPANGSSTNDQTPAISGTGLAGAHLVVYEGTTVVCETDVLANGTWTCTPTTEMAVGSHTIDAQQTNAAGTTSGKSASVTFTIDITKPNPPVITSPADGSSVNTSTPTVSGTGEPGASVNVIDKTDPDNPTTICTNVVVDASGNWTCTSSTLGDGDHTITANQTDPAGNKSDDAPDVHFTVDTQKPAAPVITSPANGSSTNDSTPLITGTGEAGDTVTVVNVTDSGNPTTVCTAKVQDDKTWSCAPENAMDDGTYTITAYQTDPAGNKSDNATNVTFTIDTAKPEPPVITSPSDGSTINTNTPTVSGTGEPGDSVNVVDVTNPDKPTTICKDVVVGEDGTWTCTSSKLDDGNHTLQATQTDPAGNTSEPSAPITVTVDTTPPGAPDVNQSNGTEITGKGTEPDGTITVTGPNGPIEGCVDVPVNSDGTFSCTPTKPIAPGTVVNVTQTDPAGNTSPATQITIQQRQAEVVHPIVNPGGTQEVTGSGFTPGETVTITMCDANGANCQPAATTTANGNGAFDVTFTVPAGTADGTYTAVVHGSESSTLLGDITLPFQVAAPYTVPTGPSPTVPTGGTVAGDLAPFGMVAALLAMAGAGMLAIRRRHEGADA